MITGMGKQKQKRMHYRSIDVLRTCSLTEMVVVHFTDYLSSPSKAFWVEWGCFGAPMFLFISGICYHIGIESQLRLLSKSDGDGMRNVRWKFAKRGACLCIVGAAIVATSQFLTIALECDAIVTSGLMQIVLAVFFWEKSSEFLIFANLSVILVTPVIRHVATTDAYWDYNQFEIRPPDPEHYYTMLDVIKLHLVAGYFPLFPYASFSILGLLVGRVLVPRHSNSNGNKYKDTNLRASKVRNISIFGTVLYGIGKWLGRINSDHAYLGGWTTYQLSFPSCIGKTGRVLMWFGIVSYVVDFRRHKKGATIADVTASRTTSLLDCIVGRYSKAPLTIYFLHHAVIFWPLRFVGWLYDTDDWWEEYATDVLEEWQATALGFFFIFLVYFFIGWIDQWHLPRIEHVMQWLCNLH